MSAKNLYFECKRSEESDDRSSVSSIPWNSDAIKQNQLTWESIERMLYCEDSLPEDNMELRQEILDWQAKFPQLTEKEENDWRIKQSSFNTSSTNISAIVDVASSVDNNDFIEFEPRTFNFTNNKKNVSRKNQRIISNNNILTRELADVFGKDLHITPLRLRLRKSARLHDKTLATSSTDSSVPEKKATTYKNTPNKAYHIHPLADTSIISNSRFHMPPILNVLESKRRFCDLTKNRSFVQLTQVQQAKSAAHSTARQPPPERRYHIWNKPLAAVAVNSRFVNNRNSIILPAIHQEPITTATSSNQSDHSAFNSFSNSNSSLSSSDIRGGRRRLHCFSNNQPTATTNTRSISAMPTHGAFYDL